MQGLLLVGRVGLLQQQFEAQLFVALAKDAVNRTFGRVLQGMTQGSAKERTKQHADDTANDRTNQEGEQAKPGAFHMPSYH